MGYSPQHYNENPKEKQKSHWFGVFLIIVFLLIIVASWFVWKYLWNFLISYEDNNIKHFSESLMVKYYDNQVDEILEEKSPEYDKFNAKEDYLSYMSDIFGDDYSQAKMIKGKTSDEGDVTYDVYLGGTKFATYIVSPDGKPNEYRHENWTVSAVNMNEELFVKSYGFKATVPENSLVYGNDILLDSEFLTDDVYTIDDYNDLDDKSLIPAFQTYNTGNIFLNKPEIKVTDSAGNVMNLIEKNGVYYALPNPSNELMDEVKKFSEKASIAYAMYITLDASFEDANKFLVQESEFTRRVKGFYHDWYRDHITTYDNVIFSDIVMYDEEHIKLNISFDYHVNIGYKTNDYDVEYTLCLIKIDGEWKIASMLM